MKVYKGRTGAAWPAVVVILALVAFGVYFFFRSMAQMKAMEREAAALPAAEKGNAPEGASAAPAGGGAAYAIRLRDLNGKAVSLAEFKGKPVFVTFWATWCRFCTGELPSIQKLYDSMKGEGVVFLLVSSEEGDRVRPFLKKNAVTVPALLQDGDLPALYRTEGIPATFILDKNGNIARKQVGAMDWDSNEVRKLLKELASS